ncbi:MAG TPA: sigma 54-interacting transcriptional regulator [Kofleriaceae bacterium]|nr:sigma 54-interacting transcriptional regulator [Kofleriaceae bacterium]
MPRSDEHDEEDELGQTAVTLVKHELGEELLPGHLRMMVISKGMFATHPLPDGAAITIGRSNQCDVTVEDESISRRHALLRIGESTTIEDLGSANGTVVRGNKLKTAHPTTIAVGELVRLGTDTIILLQHQSPLASLHKLWMHDQFMARLEEECARALRSAGAFVLLRIHSDRRAPASFVEKTLGDLVRESDILGKVGPYEYEVLLVDTPPDKADDAVRRIEVKLLEHGLKCRILVACCPRDGRTAGQLTARVQAHGRKDRVPEIVVSDPQMEGLYRLVEQVAGSNIGVLLLGETGVGKEMFARALHRASPRAAGPFVELNCAALTESLLESEMFGHEKGAFTSAVAAKPGLLEMADGGTMLLDEVGDMPLSTQAKLLRVIENSQLRRVGGLKSRSIDVRFVAATNSNLEAQMTNGTFRRDLFFRLNGITIVIPPLRERLSELEPLAHTFIRAAWPTDSRPPPTLSREALELMRGYRWPGNVRELKNVIESAALLCGGGTIRPDHLPTERMRATATTGHTIEASLATRPQDQSTPSTNESGLFARPRRKGQEEEQWIMQALERSGGNQTIAARLLGISRRTLVNRLNDYKQVFRPRKDKKQ